MAGFEPIRGETPIDPSGLRDKRIRNRRELNEAEGRNIAEAVFKYLLGGLTPEMAPFDLAWSLKLHEEMFGSVWEWAGALQKINLNLGRVTECGRRVLGDARQHFRDQHGQAA